MDEKIKDFLAKLTELTKETGIFIQEFGEEYYDPKLVSKYWDMKEEGYYFKWDIEKEMYVAKKGCPYSGEDIEPKSIQSSSFTDKEIESIANYSKKVLERKSGDISYPRKRLK